MKKKQIQGSCIFCGSTGLTKQHVFPNWLRNIIPRQDEFHTQDIMGVELHNNTVTLKPKLKYHSGSVGSRKIRIVCGNCNNGWMSSLEQLAKPILMPFILGEDTEVNHWEQIIIASWAVMTNIMIDSTALETKVISSLEIRQFMEAKIPAANWNIWLGKYEGGSDALRWSHRPIGIMQKGDKLDNEKILGKGHFTTIFVGKLLIHICCLPFIYPPEIDHNYNKNMIPIWPKTRKRVLSSEANAVMDTDNMHEFLRHLKIKKT